MNNKTSKKLRKICLTQWPDKVKCKEVYKSLKKNYKKIPKPQRGQFKKNLQTMSENTMALKKSQNIQ